MSSKNENPDPFGVIIVVVIALLFVGYFLKPHLIWIFNSNRWAIEASGYMPPPLLISIFSSKEDKKQYERQKRNRDHFDKLVTFPLTKNFSPNIRYDKKSSRGYYYPTPAMLNDWMVALKLAAKQSGYLCAAISAAYVADDGGGEVHGMLECDNKFPYMIVNEKGRLIVYPVD